jgi:hypothetical protein
VVVVVCKSRKCDGCDSSLPRTSDFTGTAASSEPGWAVTVTAA